MGVGPERLSAAGHRGCEAPPNPRVQRTRAYASLRRSPLTRHPLGGPKFWLPIVTVIAWITCLAMPAPVLGEITVDTNEPKSFRELFQRSDAVAIVWITAGLPEGIGGPWFVVQARVNWSFKGAFNNELIYFRCWQGCELGSRYLVFLKKAGHTLGELEKLERHVPLAPFPGDAEFLVPTARRGVTFPVIYEPRLGRKDSIVALVRMKEDLPATIEQGPLETHGRQNWWADYEQLKNYLIKLAQAEGERPA